MRSLLQCRMRGHVARPLVCTSRQGCIPRQLLCVVAAAKQQPQPSSSPSLKDVLQQYRGLVADTPKQAKKAAGSSNKAGSDTSQTAAKRAAAGPDRADKKPRPGAGANAASGTTGSRKKAAAGAGADKRSSSSTSRSSSNTSRGKDSISSNSSNSSNSSSRNASRSKRDSSSTSSSSSSSSSERDSSSTSSSKKDSSQKPAKPAAAAKPPPPAPSGLLPSNGKGFGSLASSSTTREAAAVATSPSSSSSSSSSSKRVLKVFRFGVEAVALQRAVNACGWQERVLQVDAIGQADMLIAVKDTAGGRHQNLTQGERSAKNAGIPFVVVGRRMTKDSLQKALHPYLNEQTPEEAAARAAALAEEAERKAFADAFFSSAA